MRHATKFVMASVVVAEPAPSAEAIAQEPAVSSETSAVSDSAHRTSDLRPLTSSPSGREQHGLVEALHCPVREQLLLALCTAPGGGAYVSTLCARLGMGQKRVSRHLRLLSMRDLVLDRRDGQQVWYAAVPDRVHYEVCDGRYTLTLSHPSGVGAAVYGPVERAIAARTDVPA